MKLESLKLGDVELDYSRPYLVGILNCTPDSFSDGGLDADLESTIARGLKLIEDGSDIVDVGGESTRPNAAEVTAADEIARVVPVIEGLRDAGVPISVDTTKAEVARAAIGAGATLVNDVSGGLFDPHMVEVIEETGAAYVLGHVRGANLAQVHGGTDRPLTVAAVHEDLRLRIESLPASVRRRVILDPCLGFGKAATLNLELTRNSGKLSAALQCPIMIGSSRKRFLGELTGRPVDQRDDASIGSALAALASGAHFVRLHAVRRARDAMITFLASMTGKAQTFWSPLRSPSESTEHGE